MNCYVLYVHFNMLLILLIEEHISAGLALERFRPPPLHFLKNLPKMKCPRGIITVECINPFTTKYLNVYVVPSTTYFSNK